MVAYLRKAETADTLRELFGCALHENRGGGLFAKPPEAKRSVCGTVTQNLRLELCANELRATLVLSSGEVLRDLPVVDRDWRDFIDVALAEGRGVNRVDSSRTLPKFTISIQSFVVSTSLHSPRHHASLS